MNILIGWVFWGNLFYLPLYFQTVRGLSPATAGSFILPMVIAHGATSGLSGVLMSLSGRYTPIITTGMALWAIGAVMKATYGQGTPFPLFFVAGILEGIGVGCGLQPGMNKYSSISPHSKIFFVMNLLLTHFTFCSASWASCRV